MMIVANNGKRIGRTENYENNFKRLILFAVDNFKVITSIGYCFQKREELNEGLDEYLEYVASITKCYDGSLEQKIEFLNEHKEFELPSKLYIANLVDAAVLKSSIESLLKSYDSLGETKEAERESLISYLDEECDYLLSRLENIAGIKYRRFEKVL